MCTHVRGYKPSNKTKSQHGRQTSEFDCLIQAKNMYPARKSLNLLMVRLLIRNLSMPLQPVDQHLHQPGDKPWRLSQIKWPVEVLEKMIVLSFSMEKLNHFLSYGHTLTWKDISERPEDAASFPGTILLRTNSGVSIYRT